MDSPDPEEAPEPVEPRPAATVVVARPGADGVEVLLLRRSRASRFAPGYVVFPGERGLPWWRPGGGQSAKDQVDAVWEMMR